MGGKGSGPKRVYTPEEAAERRRETDRRRHWRNREKRLAAQKRRYREGDKAAWKNPDGTWKMSAAMTPEKRREVGKRSYEKNKHKRLAKEKAERAANKRIGDCPICRSEQVRLVWDHCHRSGEFRGYICGLCNSMLGLGKDSAAVLRAGADYLEARLRQKAG